MVATSMMTENTVHQKELPLSTNVSHIAFIATQISQMPSTMTNVSARLLLRKGEHPDTRHEVKKTESKRPSPVGCDAMVEGGKRKVEDTG